MPTPLGRVHIPEAKCTQDYVGIDYYSTDTVAFDLTKPGLLFGRRFYPPGSDLSETGFLANEPAGFYQSLMWARQFNLPVYVTENGVEDSRDVMRPRFIAGHIQQMWRAIEAGCPVIGYFHWSLLDNFEWERGWSQRFGLWELDLSSQVRRKRRSADFYAEICRENALTSAMVEKYCPEVLAKLFPGSGKNINHERQE
jgi:beta-glucosidase